MINYVIVYAHTSRNIPEAHKIPLILKDKPKHLQGMLNLPGGKIEFGESPEIAAVRELKEETGLEIVGNAEVVGDLLANGCRIYVVTIPVEYKELEQQEGETELVEWYYPYKLSHINELMPNLRLIIPLILSGNKDWMIRDVNEWRGVESYEVDLYLMQSRKILSEDVIKVKLDGYR